MRMSDPVPTDAELILAYAAGDDAAFARLYERYRGPLYRYFRRHVATDQADDCFQALWLKVIDQAPRYRPSGTFNGWVFTLAHNLAMDVHRQRARRPERTDGAAVDAALAEVADGAATLDEAVAREEQQRRLRSALEGLPFHQRDAWLLRQEAALSVEEIARVTRTSIEGVRSRLRYANSKLKEGLLRYV